MKFPFPVVFVEISVQSQRQSYPTSELLGSKKKTAEVEYYNIKVAFNKSGKLVKVRLEVKKRLQ